MINKHQFQLSAKAFRAGRLSLPQFTDVVFGAGEELKESGSNVPATGEGVGKQGSSRHPERLQAGLPQLSQRKPEAHKGDFGRVALIGGSAGMSGAISLAALAALKSGSGLVKVAVPGGIQATVAAFSPCYMTVGCQSEDGEFHGSSLDSLETLNDWSDVVALGPGLARGPAQKWIVSKLYANTEQPMVVDADGLNSLVDAGAGLGVHAGQRVLTPHPGEFQRLIGSQILEREQLEQRAEELAGEANVIVVLKGSRTLVTDGKKNYHNQTGNPGMATAGAGDVLTGVIASLIGQGMSLFDAAVLGVHLHGMAGDVAAESVGQTSLIATDIIENLPTVFKLHAADRKQPIGF